MEVKGYKTYFRVKKRYLPKAKVVDAKNGVIQLSAGKAKKGIYELVLDAEGHAPIILKVEVI